MTLEALSGYTIGITADRRSEEQTRLLERLGAHVSVGPCIRTLPLAPGNGLRIATEALIASPPELVVLSTAIGTRAWFDAAEALGLAEDLRHALGSAQVLVRGPKAAGAALTAGLDVRWRTPHSTNAELVERLAIETAEHGPRRVAVQLDGAPEMPLAAAIGALGHDTVPVAAYQWTLPQDIGPAQRLIEQLLVGELDAITFTSAHTISNFFTLAEQLGSADAARGVIRSRQVAVVCVGPVSARRAVEMGVDHSQVIVPEHARLGSMVRALGNAFVRHRRTLQLAGHDVAVQGRMVQVAGAVPITLSERERCVLDALARRPGAVVAKAALLHEVWGAREGNDHVVEVTVNRLRRRLGDAGSGIETVIRRGYRLAAD